MVETGQDASGHFLKLQRPVGINFGSNSHMCGPDTNTLGTFDEVYIAPSPHIRHFWHLLKFALDGETWEGACLRNVAGCQIRRHKSVDYALTILMRLLWFLSM